MINEIYDYVEHGFRVFALWPIENGECTCGTSCKMAGKHPLYSSWQTVPEWSEEQLDVLVQHQAETGFGVIVKGYLVIDIDPRNGGDESYILFKQDFPHESNFVVETGGGGQHVYFKLPEDDTSAYMQHLKQYPGIDFKTTGFVVGAGSLHKSGVYYACFDGFPQEITQAPDELLSLLVKPETYRTEFQGQAFDADDEEIAHILSHVGPDSDHETWIRCGMAVHHATHGGGFHIWNAWSSGGDKYPGADELQKRWHSFGKSASNPVTIGTLIHHAQEGGYILPVTFKPDQPPAPKPVDLPFDIGNIDLLRPPSLAGQLTKWINSRSRYPREKLAVAASLTALSNIAGMKYTDDKDGVSLNLLSLCVAGSATGKEAVLQSSIEIHKALSLQPAIVGNIKSEQEIVRNLVRHQASFYLIDEIGYLLQKVENARKRGGASYLDGVVATVMAAYSKADGSFLVSGDLKDSVRMELKKELAQCNGKIEDNEDPNGYYARRAQSIQDKGLPEIELGLQRPFLSMMGMTTPVSFDEIVTAEQATNGFIGRCLIMRETETNPRRKRGFKTPKGGLPMHLSTALHAIHDNGNFSMEESPRIEYYGDKVEIPTQPEAIDMLEDAADWLEDVAEQHKGRTGLEAIVRRSYELMAKVSVILALGEGVRTPEHVRWAFCLMRQDMDTKIGLAQANIEEGTETALAYRVMDYAGEGENISTIVNRACRSRKYKREDVDKIIGILVDKGDLVEFETVHPVNGKTTKKYANKDLVKDSTLH